MALEKTTITNRRGFENVLSNPTGYNLSFGGSFRSLLKPFSTSTSSSGYPHYIVGVMGSGVAGTGLYGASSSGYNQYGDYTLGEGIISGTGLSLDLNTSLIETNVRTYGYKTPSNFIGPGYDIFGYPTPNRSVLYAASGAWATGTVPAEFAGTGLAVSGMHPRASGNLLRKVPFSKWPAGPLDIRWDMHRGVWTFSNGMWLGIITAVSASGLDSNGAVLSENIRYNARIDDGIANQLSITGILHSGPRPKPNSYKVYPLAVGDPCFIISHKPSGQDRPSFGLWIVEPPSATGCSSTSTGGTGGTGGGGGGRGWSDSDELFYESTDGMPWQSSGTLAGVPLFEGLQLYPLPFTYGGLGFNSIPSGYMVIGNISGNIIKSSLIAGSGIDIVKDLSSATGSVTIRISTGVAFVVGGVNNTITELQGLTIPLSIGQGGTGSSTKNFVDLSTDQSVQGTKLFGSGIRILNGTAGLPALSFINKPNEGIFYSSGVGLAISVSGTEQARFSSSGITLRTRLIIQDDVRQTADPVLTIRQNYFIGGNPTPTGNILQIEDWDGSRLGWFGASGHCVAKYFHVVNTTNNDIPLAIYQTDSPTISPLKIFAGSTAKFEIHNTHDKITFDQNEPGGTPGYIKLSAASGGICGYMDLSAAVGLNGGYLNLSANTAAGGAIDTSDGGGSINTRTGSIGFGVAANRTTLSANPSTSSPISVLLPSGAGTLALEVTGYTGTVVTAGSGNFTVVTWTIVNGRIMNVAVK